MKTTFQQCLYKEYISLSCYNIPEFVVHLVIDIGSVEVIN